MSKAIEIKIVGQMVGGPMDGQMKQFVGIGKPENIGQMHALKIDDQIYKIEDLDLKTMTCKFVYQP